MVQNNQQSSKMKTKTVRLRTNLKTLVFKKILVIFLNLILVSNRDLVSVPVLCSLVSRQKQYQPFVLKVSTLGNQHQLGQRGQTRALTQPTASQKAGLSVCDGNDSGLVDVLSEQAAGTAPAFTPLRTPRTHGVTPTRSPRQGAELLPSSLGIWEIWARRPPDVCYQPPGHTSREEKVAAATKVNHVSWSVATCRPMWWW